MIQYLLHQNLLFRLLKFWDHWLMMSMGAARLESAFPLGTVVVLFYFVLLFYFHSRLHQWMRGQYQGHYCVFSETLVWKIKLCSSARLNIRN